MATQTYGTHYGKTRKAAALSEEVKALQEAGVAAQTEYERVRDRNLEVGACASPSHHSKQQPPRSARIWLRSRSAVSGAVDRECD